MGALRYLLDTCTFIWLCAEPGRLGSGARSALADAGAELLLSDVAVLEIALKWQAGKLTLPKPPRSWVTEQAAIWQTTRLAISRPAIFRATELPDLHRDPFDRLLVATALEEGATVVTPDDSIRRYPIPSVW